jgi:hypothetical protein
MIQKGDRLKSDFSGRVYTVRAIEDGEVTAVGPHGPIVAEEDEIEENIDEGSIKVLNQHG